MKKNTYKYLWIFMLLSGCFSSGRNFPSDLDWIQKNNTIQKDVKMMLGQPYAIGNSGGVPTWTYAFYQYKIFGKSYYKELKFFWDDKNAVQHFSFNSSFPSDVYGTMGRSTVKRNAAEKSEKTPENSTSANTKTNSGNNANITDFNRY